MVRQGKGSCHICVASPGMKMGQLAKRLGLQEKWMDSSALDNAMPFWWGRFWNVAGEEASILGRRRRDKFGILLDNTGRILVDEAHRQFGMQVPGLFRGRGLCLLYTSPSP